MSHLFPRFFPEASGDEPVVQKLIDKEWFI